MAIGYLDPSGLGLHMHIFSTFSLTVHHIYSDIFTYMHIHTFVFIRVRIYKLCLFALVFPI